MFPSSTGRSLASLPSLPVVAIRGLPCASTTDGRRHTVQNYRYKYLAQGTRTGTGISTAWVYRTWYLVGLVQRWHLPTGVSLPSSNRDPVFDFTRETPADMSNESPKSGGSGNTKKKSVIRKGAASKSGENEAIDVTSASLERKPELGMNPVPILTGYYGVRGERIKHTVHDGALKLPKEALDLLNDATEETGLIPSINYKLPGLDGVVRPSLDAKLDVFIVTDVGLERVAVPDPSSPPVETTGDGAMSDQKIVHVLKTKIENRTIQRRPRPTTVGSQQHTEQPQTERIRGGGGDEGESKMYVDAAAPNFPVNETTNAYYSGERAMDLDKELQPPPAGSGTEHAHRPCNPSSDPIGVPPTQSYTPQNHPQAIAPRGMEKQAPVTASTDAITSLPPLAVPTYTVPVPSPAPLPPSSIGYTPLQATTDATERPSIPLRLAPQIAPAPVPQANAEVQAAPAPAPTPISTSLSAQVVPSTAISGTEQNGTTLIPSTTPSSAAATKSESAPTTTVQTLSTKPEPRWELHRPGPNDEMVTPEDQLTPKPTWYRKDGIAEIERVMLPEWFDGSAAHRTPETYIKARETILSISDTVSNRNVTCAMVRRSILGDAGSLQRLRDFMSNWGLINEDAINDSAPTAPILREKYPVQKVFNGQQRDKLITAVVEQSSKRRKLAPDNSYTPIDWEEIALEVGYGATSSDCERNFLSLPIQVEESEVASGNSERPITPEVSQEFQNQPTKDAMRQEFLRELVESTNPVVVRKTTDAALEAIDGSGNLKEAQSGALIGLIAARAVEEAKKTESQLEAILSQLLDQRMKKLENRMAMMDDVESILEAEKMALELERRDLYTARCRHWFGGA